MKKRWVITLLTGILLTGILCQNAYADEYSNEAENVSDYTYSILGDTVAITGYTGSDTEIVIPSEIDGLPVSRIGNQAFCQCEKLENVMIPESVIYIGADAFRECKNIRTIEGAENIAYIGDDAFQGCINLEKIVIQGDLSNIGAYAFSGCSSLTSVTLPDSTTGIGAGVFSGCTALEKIHLPDAVTDLGNSVFYDCKSLEEFHFPSSLRSLGSAVFSGCSSLKRIVLPENVNSTWFGMFKNCVKLEELELNDNVAWVSNEMFYGCSSLKTIVLPETCMGCTDGAFDGCTSLESLVCLSGDTNIIESGLQRLENKVIVYAPSGGMTEQTAKQIGLEFRDISKLPVKVTLVSQSGNITVTTTNDVLDSDTVLLAQQAAVSATDLIDQSAGNVRIYDLTHAAMYDIYLEKNGQKVQPNGEVTVSIPVPSTLDGQKCSVLYVDNSGKATDMNAVYKDGYMVFTTNHFSYYALVEKVKISLLGDVTGDGKVNTRDLNRLYAHVNGTNPLTGYEFACGDVTGDGKINTRDLNRLYAHISETNPLW